jgi:hypothetical protein
MVNRMKAMNLDRRPWTSQNSGIPTFVVVES